MNTSWITLYPQWYVSERNLIAQSYPEFRGDEGLLNQGVLCYYGELLVRPSGGTKRHAIRLRYPNATPFELPIITPLKSLPQFNDRGVVEKCPDPEFFDGRHQMPRGALCLFQRETRGDQGGEWLQATDVLRRAERWFLGFHTGHRPPDSHESELEPHFYYSGDVLLSKTFYAPQVTGAGQFYMVRDMRRLFDGQSTESPPLIVTAITQTNGPVHAVFDAREDLQNIFPWIQNDAWSPEKLAQREGQRQADEIRDLVIEHGYWWSLETEPQPFHNGEGFLRELKRHSPDTDPWTLLCGALGSELTTFSKHFLAFRYPGRSRQFEWLVLYMPRQMDPTPDGGLLLAVGDSEKRREFEVAPVFCYRVHGIRTEEIGLRNATVLEPKVAHKTVALIGLGALGAKVAELLAQAGVGTFHLCDIDRLATGNVARHIGGLSDFGAKKTRIVRTRLFDINPYLKVGVYDGSAVASLDTLAEFIQPAHLVISTIADENVESAINQLAVLHEKTVLYGRALRRASMGRVFLVRPRVDACKGCLGAYARASREGNSEVEWLEIKERDEDILLHECGRPVIPASAVDLSFIAGLISRVALDVFQDHEFSENHWIWSSCETTDVAPKFVNPLSTLSFDYPPHADCPVCHEPDVTSVSLSETARDTILAEVSSTMNAETGGILLGHVNDQRQAVVIRATGPGPQAKKTPTCFNRDVAFVQAELEKAANEFGSRALYIGEWHSHLESDPKPSPSDIVSMCGIAESPNYATRCPVLLIVGINTTTLEVTRLNTWSFPLGGRVYPIPHTVPSQAELPDAM